MSDPDVIVVGGGSVGLSFATEAAGLGARVVLAETDALGGTCVNRGCVPKKLMWTAAKAIHEAAGLHASGVVSAPPEVDYSRLARSAADHVASLQKMQAERLRDAGVEVRRTTAKLHDDLSVSLDDAPDAPLRAPRVVWCAGARPVKPDFDGADLAETSDDLFGWRRRPDRLLVLGGGYISCEFAAIFAAFGTEVTLVDHGDRLLSGFAPALSRLAKEHLHDAGVDTRLGGELQALREDGGRRRAEFADAPSACFDRVLAAVGRTPALGSPAETFDLRTSDAGAVRIDDRFSPGVDGLHVVGDAADRMPLTPVATADGACLARQLFGDGDAAIPLDHAARTAFVLPPIAQVGEVGEGEAERFSPLGHAVKGETPPEAWRLVENPQGALSGVALAGEAAHEMIGWAAQSVAEGRRRAALPRAVAIHPSSSEEPLG
ncbi:MAG: NAD(P)/FAD-dependent oxidoreductase [Pseudomonadota bacterium]